MKKLLFAIISVASVAVTYDDEAGTQCTTLAPGAASSALYSGHAAGHDDLKAVQVYGGPNGHKLELQYDAGTLSDIVYEDDAGEPTPPAELVSALAEIQAQIDAL